MTPDQITQFQAEGWLYQPAVAQGAELAQLIDDLHQVSGWTGWTGQASRTVVWTGPWVASEVGHGYTPVRDLLDRSLAWYRFCEGLNAEASALLGEPAYCCNATGVLKPSEIGQTFPWHQDSAYYGPPNGRYVIANVYLDDVTADNGSLQVVPQSHTQPWPHHEALGKKSVTLAPDWTVVEPQAKTGDVTWFHLWTVHGSGPNHSTRPRRAVRVGFVAESAGRPL